MQIIRHVHWQTLFTSWMTIKTDRDVTSRVGTNRFITFRYTQCLMWCTALCMGSQRCSWFYDMQFTVVRNFRWTGFDFARYSPFLWETFSTLYILCQRSFQGECKFNSEMFSLVIRARNASKRFAVFTTIYYKFSLWYKARNSASDFYFKVCKNFTQVSSLELGSSGWSYLQGLL